MGLNAGLNRSLESVRKHEKQKTEKATRRAVELLESACSDYCRWYTEGRSCDAGNKLYDVITYVRYALQELKQSAEPAED